MSEATGQAGNQTTVATNAYFSVLGRTFSGQTEIAIYVILTSVKEAEVGLSITGVSLYLKL